MSDNGGDYEEEEAEEVEEEIVDEEAPRDDDNDYEGGEFSEVTDSQGYCERLQGALVGMCYGLLLFLGAFPLLYWNEGRAVDRYDALRHAEAVTRAVPSGVEMIDPNNNGGLIYFTANITTIPPLFNTTNRFLQGDTTNDTTAIVDTTTTNDTDILVNSTSFNDTTTVNDTTTTTTTGLLIDPLFGVVTDHLKLERQVEIYQWVESRSTKTRKKLGGGKETITTYSYSRQWRQGLVDSTGFRESSTHRNPTYTPYQTQTWIAPVIYAGSFRLPADVVERRLNWWTPVYGLTTAILPDGSTRGVQPLSADPSTNDGYFVSNTSSSLSNPSVGDVRVQFSSVQPGVISVVARQDGDSFGSFTTPNGESIFLFSRGNVTVAQLYEDAANQNQAVTWVLRLIGMAVMWAGLYLLVRPIEVFADVLPILGDIIGCGLMFVAFVIAFLLSGLTIAIAWLIHHPRIGGAVLGGFVAVGAAAVGIRYCIQKKRSGGVGKQRQEEDGTSDGGGDDELNDAAVQHALAEAEKLQKEGN